MSNNRKRCGDCGRTRLVKFFAKSKSKKDGLQGICKDCGKKRSKDYYRRNTVRHRERVAESNRKARARNRDLIYKHLLANPCVDCGEGNPLMLQFDHVRGEKLGNIADLARNSCSPERVLDEIKKCDVRCANCHAVRTLLEQSTFWREVHEQWIAGANPVA